MNSTSLQSEARSNSSSGNKQFYKKWAHGLHRNWMTEMLLKLKCWNRRNFKSKFRRRLPRLSTLITRGPSAPSVPTSQPDSQAFQPPTQSSQSQSLIQTSAPIADNSPGRHSRLPKLTLPTFSGDPLEWLTFWDSFNAAVNTNTSLGGVEKFNYLRAQLRGEAERAVAGFPLTNDNYSKAIATLQERFGQTHKVVNAHMTALLEPARPSTGLDRRVRSF